MYNIFEIRNFLDEMKNDGKAFTIYKGFHKPWNILEG